MNRNEVRQRENLDAADGLDEFLEPQNMAPAGSREFGEDGGEESRFSAMRENAARATASILTRQAERNRHDLYACVDDVARIMALPQIDAMAFIDEMHAYYNPGTEHGPGLDEFEREAALRLMEL